MQPGKVLFLSVIVAAAVFSAMSPAAAADYGFNYPQEANTTCAVFFYSPTCPHCDRVEQYLNKSDPDIKVEKLQASKNLEEMKKYLNAYDVPQQLRGSVPFVVVGDEYAVGDSPAISLLESSQGKKTGCPDVHQTAKSDNSTESLTVAGISGLALVDAVNPCALAVLILLLSHILSQKPDQEREALKSGLAFSLSIAVSYLAMGLLIVLGFKSVVAATQLELSWLHRGLGAFAVLIGLFNIKDWISHGLGGFVMEVPFSWRPRMQEIIKSVASAPGAAITGVLVSMFLLPCTSGPYFVAGGMLSQLSWSGAVPWLLLYNLLFISPMVAITLAVYGGYVSVDRAKGWREENIERLHLFAGAVMIAIGLLLFLGLV